MMVAEGKEGLRAERRSYQSHRDSLNRSDLIWQVIVWHPSLISHRYESATALVGPFERADIISAYAFTTFLT